MTTHVAFLGYDRSQTRLIPFLEGRGCAVTRISDRVEDLSAYDLVISFGYRFILKPQVIGSATRPILNLHISYLPYNRGAHPNFWSWVDGTPSGVTIHEIAAGVDTGQIVFQALLDDVGPKQSFREVYARLKDRIETLFEDNAASILNGRYEARPQEGEGTSHKLKDLPEWVDWDMKIADAIARYRADV